MRALHVNRSGHIFTCTVLAVAMFSAVAMTTPVRANDEPRKGTVVGKFVRLYEASVEGRNTPAVMVDTGKEGGEQTVIFSRFRKRLLDRARELQPGQRVSISYVREMGFLWASEMEVLKDEPPSDIDTDKVTEDLPTDVAELQRRVKALVTELERLRLENERLRKELELLRDAREKPEAVADAKAETDTKDIFEDEPEQKGVDPLAEPITARGALRANVQKYVGTVIKGERYVGIVVREDGATESVTIYVPRQTNEQGKSETLPSVKTHAEKLTPGKYARIDWVEQAGHKWLRSAIVIDRGGGWRHWR